MKYLAILTLLVSVGCAAQDRRAASLGVLTDGDNAILQGRYATFEKDKVGFFASLGAGGTPTSTDEFGKDTGPFVPGPESAASTRSDDSAFAIGAAGGVTYQPLDQVALVLGMSLYGEQATQEYRYTTPFSGSGRYHTDGDIETKVGIVVGVDFFNSSDWTLGVLYDSAPGDDGMFGLTIGYSF